MKIYHGGYMEIKNPQILASKYAKDFGQGYYCTELKAQAIRWAKRYETPVVSVYDYCENKNLNSCHFLEMSEEWLDFIVKCRDGIKHPYDIVAGPMANDQIYNYISDFIEGVLTKEQFWALAKFKYPTHQICFHSKKALNCLTFICSEKYDR